LFGVQHAVVHVPRQSTWEQLKIWLAVESNVRKSGWPNVWQAAIRRKPGFFQRCVAVTLARASRSLPPGTVIFETLSDFVAVPDRELDYLSAHDRQRVKQALRQAMLDFPDERPQHLLRPVFVGTDKARRLATLDEVRSAADDREELLHEFCKKRGPRVPLAMSEDHLQEARELYERRLRAAQHRLQRLIARPVSRDDARFRAMTLERARLQELVPLVGLAAKLGIPLLDPQRALASYRLETWDPVIVMEEPKWRLPCYGEDVIVFRTAVHWDDHGVTTIG